MADNKATPGQNGKSLGAVQHSQAQRQLTIGGGQPLSSTAAAHSAQGRAVETLHAHREAEAIRAASARAKTLGVIEAVALAAQYREAARRQVIEAAVSAPRTAASLLSLASNYDRRADAILSGVGR